jgi:hypothetical protein
VQRAPPQQHPPLPAMTAAPAPATAAAAAEAAAAAAAAAATAAAAAAAPSLERCASVVLPNPVFEGSEKRVEVDFEPSEGTPPEGLRALGRAVLDELMGLARCTIVSSRTNDYLDAYVLSESSLFVYPTKWVLKTCGTTRLLDAVPRLLELAAARLGMAPRRCKYSRASFLFPEQQPAPYREGFDQEARFLRSHFGAPPFAAAASCLHGGPPRRSRLTPRGLFRPPARRPTPTAPPPPPKPRPSPDQPATHRRPPATPAHRPPGQRRQRLRPGRHVQRPAVARVRCRRARRRRGVRAAGGAAVLQVRGAGACASLPAAAAAAVSGGRRGEGTGCSLSCVCPRPSLCLLLLPRRRPLTPSPQPPPNTP